MIVRGFGIRTGRVLFLAGAPPLKTELEPLLPELPFAYQPHATFALLHFTSQTHALTALETLKDKQVGASKLRVRLAAPRYKAVEENALLKSR